MHNIPESINSKRLLKLHNNPRHPLCQMKRLVQHYFTDYACFDDLSEEVSIKENFDDLLIPAEHPARSANDTYYLDDNTVLRTHTSAHQTQLLKQGKTKFLVTGDVYRKDTIDKNHYPVFHQMEGVKILPSESDALHDLLNTLEGLVHYLFPEQEYRFLDDYFPFTNPSVQAEVRQGEEWIEILGGGVIQSQILRNCNITGTGWAFGLGIDRLLMNKCRIPDIRYLWSMDARFINQFKDGLVPFTEYSKYPAIARDISFWVDNLSINHEGTWDLHNSFCELCRDIGQDLIESISLIDTYSVHSKTSLAYRIMYRSNDRTLLNDEVNNIQEMLRNNVTRLLGVVLR